VVEVVELTILGQGHVLLATFCVDGARCLSILFLEKVKSPLATAALLPSRPLIHQPGQDDRHAPVQLLLCQHHVD
jgi:hypothetical protein